MDNIPFNSQDEVRIVTSRFELGDLVRIPAELTDSEAKAAIVIQVTPNIIVVEYEKTKTKESFVRAQMANVLILKKGDK